MTYKPHKEDKRSKACISNDRPWRQVPRSLIKVNRTEVTGSPQSRSGVTSDSLPIIHYVIIIVRSRKIYIKLSSLIHFLKLSWWGTTLFTLGPRHVHYLYVWQVFANRQVTWWTMIHIFHTWGSYISYNHILSIDIVIRMQILV